jgi:hypothetical protein
VPRRLKILSLGWDFDDDRVRSVGLSSAQTVLDQDVVFLTIDDVLEEFAPYRGARYSGLSSLDESASRQIREHFARRRAEFDEFLGLGRTLVIFVPKPDSWYYDTGERSVSGTGRSRVTSHHVSLMSVFEILPFSLKTKVAASDDLEIVSGEPFAALWRENREMAFASAAIEGEFGTPLAVIRGTKTAVAALAKFREGQVVLLPSSFRGPADDVDDDEEEERAKAAESEDSGDEHVLDPLLDYIRAISADVSVELPKWADDLRLPGESEKLEGIDKLQRSIRGLELEAATAADDLARLTRRKLLLAGSGLPLERIAAEALAALGFAVDEGQPGRSDRIIELDGSVAVLEVKGKAKSASEADAAQLEKWVSEHLAESNINPKGILLVNGWRALPLSERTEPVFPKQMLTYAERRDHCLITGAQLLQAWQDAEATPGDRDAIAKSILSTVGRYSRYDGLSGLDHSEPARD